MPGMLRRRPESLLAGVPFAALLLAASALQLRPFSWDTYRVSASLRAFDRHRVPLMGGACLRAGLLLACVALAGVLWRRLRGAVEPLVAGGVMLLLAGGLLGAAAGAVGMALGVPAEEYHPAMADAKAVEVLADSLYWVQDGLVTLADLALAGAAGTLALAMRARGGFPAWATGAGLLALPLAATAAASFVCITANLQRQPWWYVAWYAAAMGGALVALAAWAVGATLAPRPGPPPVTAGRAGGAARTGGPAGTGSRPAGASR
jgi:hypothetical protein